MTDQHLFTPRQNRRLLSPLPRSLAWVLVLLLFSAWPSTAGNFAVFGPQSYPRSTGQPIPFSNSFSVLNPSTQYFLQVQVAGVASATISVNGVTVVFPSDFDMNETFVERPVALQPSNVLSGEVRGKPDGAITVRVIGIDNDPPTITAEAAPPPNASGWNNNDVTVVFTADDAISGVASVTPPVTVSAEGGNQTVSGTATDRAGNSASTSLTLSIDKTPPTAAIAQPSNGAVLNALAITVTGTVADALSGLERVTCNGAAAALAGSTFACEVSLAEGPNSILVEATDRADNMGFAGVEVTSDRTPPVVTITSPTSGATFRASPITVTGTAADALSGIASMTCNGGPALLSAATFTCEVPLAPGANSLLVRATDLADNSASQSVTVTLEEELSPPPNAIEITPSTLALVLDEPRQLSLVDDYGRQLAGASWSVSDTTVAEISIEGMVVVTGKAAGAVTVTATWQNFTADAEVTVFPGPDLPDGTIPWSIQPTPGYSTNWMVHAQPAQNMPHLYSVEEDGTGNTIVRALTIEGLQIWKKSVNLSGTAPEGATATVSAATTQAPTELLVVKVLGDTFGGVLLQFEDENYYSQIVRLDGATGEVSWRYVSPWWLYYDWALHHDGTIFVGEIPSADGYIWGTDNLEDYDIQVVAIDGTTGVVKSRVPVPRSYQQYRSNCPYVENWVYPFFSGLGAPMVAPNGSLYVEAAMQTWIGELWEPACRYQDQRRIQNTSLLLLEVLPDGSFDWHTLKEEHSEGNIYDVPAQPDYFVGEVIPDGQGGLLAAWSYSVWAYPNPVHEARVIRVTDSAQSEYTLPFLQWGPSWSFSPPNRSLVLGENGVAFATSWWGQKVVSFEVGSGTVRWTWQAPGRLDMVAATSGNGLVGQVQLEDGTVRIVRIDSTGQASYDEWLGGAPGMAATATASTTSSATVDPTTINWIEYLVGEYWLGWQYLGSGMWNAVPLVAAPIPWGSSVFPTPTQSETNASDGVIPLTVYRIIDESTISESAVRDQAITAMGYWEMAAGIHFEYDGMTVHNVGPCPDPNATECDAPVDLRFFPTDPEGGPWLEAYKRFCTKDASGTNVGLYAHPPYCTPQGSTVIFTVNIANPEGNVMGATSSIRGNHLNFSVIGRRALELVVAHELGHQLGLPDCGPIAFSMIEICGGRNLMYDGFGKPEYPAGRLARDQRERAKQIATRWRKRP